MADSSKDVLSTEEMGRYRGGASRRSPAQNTGGGMGITLMLAIMVAGLAGAGWFIANQQQSMLAHCHLLELAVCAVADCACAIHDRVAFH